MKTCAHSAVLATLLATRPSHVPADVFEPGVRLLRDAVRETQGVVA